MGLRRLFSSLAVFFSRLMASFSRSHKLHTAKFAGLHDLTSLLSGKLDGASLLLGVSRFSQLLRVRPTPARRELGNLLIVAPTRGGKGLLAVSQLLTWPHSAIVNDIKGELFAATAGYRQTLGKVFVLDPTGVGHCYDPLLGKHTEDALFSSATHLLFKPDEGEGAIFTQRATVMLTQLFLAVRKEGYSPLPYVRSILRSGLTATARRLNTLSAELAIQFLDVAFGDANFSDRFLLSAWGTLSARLRPLLTETVVRSLAGADFTPWELMRSAQPVTVYLRWSERDLLARSPLVRLLWGSFIDELITTYDRSQVFTFFEHPEIAPGPSRPYWRRYSNGSKRDSDRDIPEGDRPGRVPTSLLSSGRLLALPRTAALVPITLSVQSYLIGTFSPRMSQG